MDTDHPFDVIHEVVDAINPADCHDLEEANDYQGPSCAEFLQQDNPIDARL